MTNCYYLVYKLKFSNILWIINIMETPDYFLDKIKNINSKEEKYYIIMKEVRDIDSELEFKNFTIFKIDYNCHIIDETNIL